MMDNAVHSNSRALALASLPDELGDRAATRTRFWRMPVTGLALVSLLGFVVRQAWSANTVDSWLGDGPSVKNLHWQVQRPEWPNRTEQYFRTLDAGRWQVDKANATDFVLPGQVRIEALNVNASRACLQNKWIMLHGDSSLRMVFGSLAEYFGGSAVVNDPFMPKHGLCPGGDCKQFYLGMHANRTEPQNFHEQYFREYWRPEPGLRLTYCFKQNLEFRHVALESFITDSMQPDLLVLQGGAWNKNAGDTVDGSIEKMRQFIADVPRYYRGPVLWVDLVACAPDLRDWASEFNRKSLHAAGIPVLSRQAITQDLPATLAPMCKDWHGHGPLSDLPRDALLHALCDA